MYLYILITIWRAYPSRIFRRNDWNERNLIGESTDAKTAGSYGWRGIQCAHDPWCGWRQLKYTGINIDIQLLIIPTYHLIITSNTWRDKQKIQNPPYSCVRDLEIVPSFWERVTSTLSTWRALCWKCSNSRACFSFSAFIDHISALLSKNI